MPIYKISRTTIKLITWHSTYSTILKKLTSSQSSKYNNKTYNRDGSLSFFCCYLKMSECILMPGRKKNNNSYLYVKETKYHDL